MTPEARALPIRELEMSVRAVRILTEVAGLRTLGDVADKTDDWLLKLPQFGRKSLREVREVQSSYYDTRFLQEDQMSYPRIEELRSFRTRDGQLHKTLQDAQRADARLRLREWVDERGLGRGGDWSPQMIAEELLEHAAELARLLAPLVEEDDE